jgi:translocation and assembly module TamB
VGTHGDRKPNQQVSGPVVVAADFGGRVNQPTLNGLVRADALRYENQTYGTIITNLAVAGRFTRSQLQLVSLTGRAGRGTVAGRGTIGLDAASGFPVDLTLTFANAQLARSDALGATVSGNLAIANGPRGGRISGTLTVPEARYEIVRQGGAEIVELTGVRRKNSVLQTVQAAPRTTPMGAANFALDIRIRADNQIFVSGMGLEAEWSTDMRVAGTAASPQVTGRLEVIRGTYSFAGKRFDLDNNGRITFDGPLTNPQIALVARTNVQSVSATIDISGRAQNPQIAFSSTPALPQDEVLSRLLFGSSVTSLSPVQAIQLAAALNSLRGSGGGLNPLGKLRSASGVSRLRILGADQASGRGTALAAGQYISKNIYVEVITDARGFTATQLEIGLSRTLSLLSQTSSFGGSSATLQYSRDY